jgi:hypothetical protein
MTAGGLALAVGTGVDPASWGMAFQSFLPIRAGVVAYRGQGTEWIGLEAYRGRITE